MESSSLITPVKKQPVVSVSVAASPTVITPDRFYNTFQIRNKSKGLEKLPALLPIKYEMLCDLFNAMVSSITLLRLRRLPATLSKLSQNIESLTDRRFTLRHLGQLKHIVPDIVDVKKTCVPDNKTHCIKEDLLISLDVETDKTAKGGGGYNRFKGFFRSRIVDYARTHPEIDDLPEAELPSLFYKPKQEPETSFDLLLFRCELLCKFFNALVRLLRLKQLPTTFTKLSRNIESLTDRRFTLHHLGQLKHIVHDIVVVKKISVQDDATWCKEDLLISLEFVDETDKMQKSVSDDLPEGELPDLLYTSTQEPTTTVDSTPLKFDSTPAKLASTPAKLASTRAGLMALTPALRTPKRSLMVDDSDAGLPTKSAKRSRSLKFDDDNSAVSNDLPDVLPEKLLYSEKERKTFEEQEYDSNC